MNLRTREGRRAEALARTSIGNAACPSYPHNRWYRIRLRVVPGKIEAWIDDKNVVAVNIKGKRISIRPEVELSVPVGIATWNTEAAPRNIKLRKLN